MKDTERPPLDPEVSELVKGLIAFTRDLTPDCFSSYMSPKEDLSCLSCNYSTCCRLLRAEYDKRRWSYELRRTP